MNQERTLGVSGLTKSYAGKPALLDTSFEVAAGEIFGFVGANGAGKTTTMRIILGVLTADAGDVTLGGRPIDHEARRRIGYMPEERGLYPKMRVGDQLVHLARLYGMGRSRAVAAMERWTERLGVADRRADEVQKLSLGNQQRVQLAAALTHDPEVLVLDEPFSGLDPVAVDVMSAVLREQAAAGAPVIFSSHQLDLVERLCDRVGIIKEGRMVAVGATEELRRYPHPRWVIDGPGADWAAELDGVRVVSANGSRTVVDVPDAGPDAGQRLLAAASAAGTVREFAPLRPSLTELYRDVVADDEEAA
ncbi:ABC transporter ATP-binding protein [Nocardioides limicola]|uniref:ABC transporter ATP-binding protein n=1 Tax=Nocardioides limicola TaxID=2803368 RepID=UPI00193C4084|nr:ATP-binding cassette domain-containing protein [Nocardioides sp. DJM-14]